MAIYERHCPESTVLNQSVARAWTLIDVEYSLSEQSIPSHVSSEFERYTRCGILEHGFVRLYRMDCQSERVIGFSCKGRGFCPSCGSRRALQKARMVVDDAITDGEKILEVIANHGIVSTDPPTRRQSTGELAYISDG